MTVRLTVLCAVHDAAPFLRESLDSILGQTFEAFELLLIDDGSTDESPAILAEYRERDSRVVVVQQENVGLTRSLNRGLARATGELVARHDADDVSLPHRLAQQVAFLDAHPEVAVLGCNYRRIDATGRALGEGNVPISDFAIKWKLLTHNVIAHPTALFRRDRVLEIGGYDEALRTAQDYDLWCRMALRWELSNLPQVGLLRREHGGRIGVKHQAEQVKTRDLIRDRYRRDLSESKGRGVLLAFVRARARLLRGLP